MFVLFRVGTGAKIRTARFPCADISQVWCYVSVEVVNRVNLVDDTLDAFGRWGVFCFRVQDHPNRMSLRPQFDHSQERTHLQDHPIRMLLDP